MGDLEQPKTELEKKQIQRKKWIGGIRTTLVVLSVFHFVLNVFCWVMCTLEPLIWLKHWGRWHAAFGFVEWIVTAAALTIGIVEWMTFPKIGRKRDENTQDTRKWINTALGAGAAFICFVALVIQIVFCVILVFMEAPTYPGNIITFWAFTIANGLMLLVEAACGGLIIGLTVTAIWLVMTETGITFTQSFLGMSISQEYMPLSGLLSVFG